MAIKQKYNHLEMELRTSDDTLLSMLEYGADPKEMEHPGADCLLSYSTAQPSPKQQCKSHQNGFWQVLGCLAEGKLCRK